MEHENDISEEHKASVSSSAKKNRTVCAVPGCFQKYGRGYSFHAFPKRHEKKRWNDWLQKLRMKIEPTATSRVCSAHFSISNFIPPTSNRTTDRMILRGSAIPDQNLPLPVKNPSQIQLAVDRAARAAKRNPPENTTYDDVSATDVVIEGEASGEVDTTEAAVQVDTLDIDKLMEGRRRTMAITFKNDSELSSWTGLASMQMLHCITSSIKLLASYKRKIHSTVTLEEEVLIVFIKMKTNLSFSCLSGLLTSTTIQCH